MRQVYSDQGPYVRTNTTEADPGQADSPARSWHDLTHPALARLHGVGQGGEASPLARSRTNFVRGSRGLLVNTLSGRRTAVVLPVVGVTIPDNATAPEVRALLDACDRAFQRGGCVEAEPDEPVGETELRAVVEWLSATEARVSVQRASDLHSDQQSVSFELGDADIERYRALGFTIGTLASPLAIEEAQAAAEPVPLVEPAPVTEEAGIAAPAYDEPPDPLPPTPLPAALSKNYLELGLLAGSGFQQPRFGVGLHFWMPVYQRWSSELSLSYAAQPETADRVALSFVSAEALAGPRFMAGPALLSIGGGVQVQHLSGTLGDESGGRPHPALGPVASLHLRFESTTFSPFLAGRVSFLDETEIAVQELDADGSPATSRRVGVHGPWQFDARAGVSLSLDGQ